jgi:hypothetical protein
MGPQGRIFKAILVGLDGVVQRTIDSTLVNAEFRHVCFLIPFLSDALQYQFYNPFGG